ncbi:MAG: ATP-dependent DNA helicase RecG [Acidimicrobiia bacterium]
MRSLAYLATVDIAKVPGLGGQGGVTLRKAGISTVADLLLLAPRKYLDRSRTEPIAQAPVGEEVTLLVRVVSSGTRRPRRNLVIVEARLTDGTATFKAVWFNQLFRERQLEVGAEVAISGKLERFRGNLQMNNPAVDILDSPKESLRTGRVVPIHPQMGKIKAGHIRRWIHNALGVAGGISEVVPAEILHRQGVVGRDDAFTNIHFPPTPEDAAVARRRLVFDEFFRLELALALQKRKQMAEARGTAHQIEGELVSRFVSGLPYDLTASQHKVLAEINADLASGHPMHRLLQGEVGSGKTVVAVATLLVAIQGGWQGAVMAPTEVLAEQHFLAIRALLEMAGLSPVEEGDGARRGMANLFATDKPQVRMVVLTSSQARANYDPGASRTEIIEAIASGNVDLVIGTHSLIQEGVDFARLAIAVIDEQHRFGVGQRVLLKEKATESDPDLLIMTATPIPRTLSMTLYGDLDVSIIAEMPPGRSPVKTIALGWASQQRAWDLVEREVKEGRQAFVVCPLVEDSPKIEVTSATSEFERLQAIVADLRLGLIHGQLHSRDKEAVMAAFRAGEIDVLVSTTVIEVGIDVPNATVMVIEDADRFGLSQLHQLRGRVGRGAHQGTCVLIADPTTEEGETRLSAMVATNDGFRLAEEDLRLRGQGTVFGARQSGIADLRLADLLADFDQLVAARTEAFALVDRDPDLSSHPDLREEVRVMLGERVEWLFRS